MTYSQTLVDGKRQLRRRPNHEDIDLLDTGTEAISETYRNPTLMIRVPTAARWAPYEFREDGNLSHCGVEVFEMLKIDGRWVMGNPMWTAEPGACAELQQAARTPPWPVEKVRTH